MGPGFTAAYLSQAMAAKRTFKYLHEYIQASGLEDAYLAILDDMDSEELWREVARHVGPTSVVDPLRFEKALHEYVQELGKRRRVALSAGRHMPVEAMAAGGLLAERRQPGRALE